MIFPRAVDSAYPGGMAKPAHPFTPAAARDKRPNWPASRNHTFEHTLADATRRQVAVKILCKGDEFYRTFEPHVLYMSQTRQVFVAGVEIDDPAHPGQASEWQTPEVGRLRDVQLTTRAFRVDPRFNRTDPQYSSGVICSVE